MKDSLQFPIVALMVAALVAVPALFLSKNKSATPQAQAQTLVHGQAHVMPTPMAYQNRAMVNPSFQKSPASSKNTHAYAMPEPFAADAPFDYANFMQPMNAMAWMQLGANMMNYMQMAQMMQQMTAMPMQMMTPTMWMNPNAMQNQAAATMQKPMSPEEYKKWYQEQQELLQSK
ncbi:MAG: hypothetical protein ACRBDX_05790 [Gammaproteobacteria bacterium]